MVVDCNGKRLNVPAVHLDFHHRAHNINTGICQFRAICSAVDIKTNNANIFVKQKSINMQKEILTDIIIFIEVNEILHR